MTDAALVAGRIDAQRYLGGHMAVDAALARAALERFGAPLGLDADATALGILRLANAHMIAALGLVSVQRGHDPRAFTLVASGGGGALHAAELAAELRIARVLIPPLPAVFSAWGMLVSDVRRDVVRTRVLSAAQADPQAVDAVWREMEDELAALLPRRGPPGRRGAPGHRGGWSCATAARSTPSPSPRRPGQSSPATLAALYAAFHAEHERRYGYRLDSPVEIVTFHATALAQHRGRRPLAGAQGQGRVRAFAAGRAGDETRALLGYRSVLFAEPWARADPRLRARGAGGGTLGRGSGHRGGRRHDHRRPAGPALRRRPATAISGSRQEHRDARAGGPIYRRDHQRRPRRGQRGDVPDAAADGQERGHLRGARLRLRPYRRARRHRQRGERRGRLHRLPHLRRARRRSRSSPCRASWRRATCSSPTTPMAAAARTSPTWR